VTCFGETLPCSTWPEVERALAQLDDLGAQETLSSGYIYRLLQFVEMRKLEKAGKPEAAIWRARFQYLTRRYIVDKRRGLDESGRLRLFGSLARGLGDAIEKLGSAYRITLFNHLYRTRGR
jgi:CRISPR-associated protein Csm1